MGFFETVLKQMDQGLKIVESGELEKKLDLFADTVEKQSRQADKQLGKLADKPAELLKMAEQRTLAVEKKVDRVARPLRRKIDI